MRTTPTQTLHKHLKDHYQKMGALTAKTPEIASAFISGYLSGLAQAANVLTDLGSIKQIQQELAALDIRLKEAMFR